MISEYRNEIDSDTIVHINKDHGVAGRSDKLMGDLSEIEHIEYLLNHYEEIGIGKGSRKFKNRDGSKARTIELKTRINNSIYHVIEAVPDTDRKTLKIISEYKKRD